MLDSYITGRLFSAKRQYGRFTGGWKPLSPHLLKGIKNLYELPVSVSPFLRLPFHFGIALTRGWDYFRRCAEGYIRRGLPLLYLFHGIDFVDARPLTLTPHRRGRSFFNIPPDQKMALAERILDHISRSFTIERACDYVSRETKNFGG